MAYSRTWFSFKNSSDADFARLFITLTTGNKCRQRIERLRFGLPTEESASTSIPFLHRAKDQGFSRQIDPRSTLNRVCFHTKHLYVCGSQRTKKLRQQCEPEGWICLVVEVHVSGLEQNTRGREQHLHEEAREELSVSFLRCHPPWLVGWFGGEGLSVA